MKVTDQGSFKLSCKIRCTENLLCENKLDIHIM